MKATFQERINQIDSYEWKSLFRLIPDIEATDNFAFEIRGEALKNGVFILPHTQNAPVVSDFEHRIQSMGLLKSDFNWMGWPEGKAILKHDNVNFENLDIQYLCKLLILIYRTDELLKGYLVQCFERGIILNILKSLEQKVYPLKL